MEEKLYQELAQITPIEAMQRKENKFHSDFAEKSLINSSQLDSKQLPIFSDEFLKIIKFMFLNIAALPTILNIPILSWKLTIF